ncbi:MAG: hypothetical protein ACKVTZ_21610 [Bacteroidia bacterium]
MRYSLAIILLFALTSCGKKHDFDQVFAGNCWEYSKPIQFQPMIQQANAKLQYELQFTDEYNFQNLNLKIHLKSPSGKIKDTLLIDTLMNGLGVWRGEYKSGKHHVPFKKVFTVPFAETGKYEIEIQHSMRKDTLCGISGLGVDLVK